MINKFSVTYEVITPESAEHGDFAETGFILPGEWKVSAEDPGEVTMSLRDAINLCYPQQDSGSWFSEVDGREDYRTGAKEFRNLHPPENITSSSYNRIKKLLNVK